MKAADWGHRIPPELRREIEANESLKQWTGEGRTLEQIWTDPVAVERLVGGMSRLERAVLEAVVIGLGPAMFDWKTLETACSGKLTGAQAKVGFVLLLRKGALFAVRKSWGEHAYFMPGDTFAVCQRLLLRAPLQPDNAMKRLQPQVASAAEDLFQLLLYVAKNNVPLTQKGALHKRHIQQLTGLLESKAAFFTQLGLVFAYADQYPPVLAVYLDLALRLGLLRSTGDAYELCEEAVADWLTLTIDAQNTALFRLWEQVHPPLPALQRHLCRALELLELGDGLSLTAAGRWLRDNGIGPADDEKLAAEWKRWLEAHVAALAGFGWLHIEENGAGVVYWLMKPQSRSIAAGSELDSGNEAEAGHEAEERLLYVQPDFEIILPPSPKLAVRWELECIAETVRIDHASIYKLTQSSVASALDSGRTAERIVAFLERHALYGVPENVRQAVVQWGDQLGKLAFSRVVMLRCQDAETAARIQSSPRLAELTGEKIGDKDFIVAEENAGELLKRLAAAGFFPGKQTGQGQAGRKSSSGTISAVKSRKEQLPEEDDRIPYSGEPSGAGVGRAKSNGDGDGDAEPAAGSGLIGSSYPASLFQLDARLPDIRDLYPNLEQVPAMWYKDYRAYHPSTSRQLVEQAIEWKTALQLRVEGADSQFVPTRLQETRETWLMHGSHAERGEETLTPDEWLEMKLIIPGINDK